MIVLFVKYMTISSLCASLIISQIVPYSQASNLSHTLTFNTSYRGWISHPEYLCYSVRFTTKKFECDVITATIRISAMQTHAKVNVTLPCKGDYIYIIIPPRKMKCAPAQNSPIDHGCFEPRFEFTAGGPKDCVNFEKEDICFRGTQWCEPPPPRPSPTPTPGVGGVIDVNLVSKGKYNNFLVYGGIAAFCLIFIAVIILYVKWRRRTRKPPSVELLSPFMKVPGTDDVWNNPADVEGGGAGLGGGGWPRAAEHGGGEAEQGVHDQEGGGAEGGGGEEDVEDEGRLLPSSPRAEGGDGVDQLAGLIPGGYKLVPKGAPRPASTSRSLDHFRS